MPEVSGTSGNELVSGVSQQNQTNAEVHKSVRSSGKKILYQFSTILSLCLNICFSTSYFQKLNMCITVC